MNKWFKWVIVAAIVAGLWFSGDSGHALLQYALWLLGGLLLIILDAGLSGWSKIKKLRKEAFGGYHDKERELGSILIDSDEGRFWLRRCAERGDVQAVQKLCSHLIGLSYRKSFRRDLMEGAFWGYVLFEIGGNCGSAQSTDLSHLGSQAIKVFEKKLSSEDLEVLRVCAAKAVASGSLVVPAWIVRTPNVSFGSSKSDF